MINGKWRRKESMIKKKEEYEAGEEEVLKNIKEEKEVGEKINLLIPHY